MKIKLKQWWLTTSYLKPLNTEKDHIENARLGLGQVKNVSEYIWVIGSAGFRTNEALC